MEKETGHPDTGGLKEPQDTPDLCLLGPGEESEPKPSREIWCWALHIPHQTRCSRANQHTSVPEEETAHQKGKRNSTKVSMPETGKAGTHLPVCLTLRPFVLWVSLFSIISTQRKRLGFFFSARAGGELAVRKALPCPAPVQTDFTAFSTCWQLKGPQASNSSVTAGRLGLGGGVAGWEQFENEYMHVSLLLITGMHFQER